jgi:Ca2+-binding RTX toxin-like protein
MKRLTLLLAVMGMALLLSAGVAFAATFDCIANRGCIGTNGPDTLNGSTGDDFMDAMQDDDELFGNEGHDFMSGDAFAAPNNDTSTDGDDLLEGGPGFDDMTGYGGADEFSGGANGDFIFAEESSENEGEDTVNSGGGNDFIQAIDQTKDTINCGKGKRDIAFFDKGGVDTVANNCEFKNRFPGEELSRAASSGTKMVNTLRAR